MLPQYIADSKNGTLTKWSSACIFPDELSHL